MMKFRATRVMHNFNLGRSGSRSSSSPRSIVPRDLGGIRGDLASLFQSELKGRGSSIFNDPGGISGKIFQNLFGDNPANDFLGARQSLQDTLSGQSLQRGTSQAFQSLLPSALNSFRHGSEALRSAAGPQGLRFSTALQGNQRGLLGDILRGTQQQAVGAGLQNSALQAQTASGIFDLSANLREADLGRLLPLLVGFATQFAPVGQQSQSFSSQTNVGGGLT